MGHRLLLLGTDGSHEDGPSGPISGDFDGVTGFTDFSDEAPQVNGLPLLWTPTLHSVDARAGAELDYPVIRAKSLSGYMLVPSTNTDGFAGSFSGMLRWDALGSAMGDYEVLILMRASVYLTGPSVFSDTPPDPGPLYVPSAGAALGHTHLTNGRTYVYSKTPGAASWGSTNFDDIEASAGGEHERRWLRVRRDGKRYRAKVWVAGTAEPGAWEMDRDNVLTENPTGFLGIIIADFVRTQAAPAVEYFAVTTAPDATPLVLPDDVAVDPNTGVVDMSAATVGENGFVHYPLISGATPTIEARAGSLHGNVLKVVATGNPNGVLAWAPAGRLFDGALLALIEVANCEYCGPGFIYPRTPVGPFYTNSWRCFGMLSPTWNELNFCGDVDLAASNMWSYRHTTSGVTQNAGERWWVRYEKIGQFVHMRAWKYGAPEPTTWQKNINGMGNYETIGWPGIGYGLGNGQAIYVEHLAWTDDIAGAPIQPEYPGTFVALSGAPADRVAKAMEVAADGSIVMGCENDGAMYRSTDDGHTWALVQSLGAGVRVAQILRLASGNLLAFVRTDATTWRSTDNGQTWTSGAGPTGTYPRADATVQLVSGRLVSGCNNGHVFTSDDNGDTWTDRGQLGSAAVVYSMELAANGNVVAGTNEAGGGLIYVSTDSGATWAVATTMPATKMASVHGIVLAANGHLVATGGITNSIWRSVDHGVTWTEDSVGIGGAGGLNLTIYRVPSTGTLLTMGTKEAAAVQVRRSTDHGVTWTPTPSTEDTGNAELQKLATTSSENGRAFLETPGGGILACLTGAEPVWRSVDDGDTWVNPTT